MGSRRFGILILSLVLCAAFAGPLRAQSDVTPEVQQYLEFKRLLDQVQRSVSQVPYEVRRVAFIRLEADTSVPSDQLPFMKSEIERVINATGAITLISIAELDFKPVLEISGSDTSITISNRSPGSINSGDPEAMTRIMRTYRIQGVMSGIIRYSPALGYSLSLRIARPESRELMWAHTIETRVFVPEVKLPKPKIVLVGVGAGAISVGSYDTGQAVISSDLMLANIGAGLMLRQPFNRTNSGYIGLRAAIHYLNLIDTGSNPDFESFSEIIPAGGVFLQKTFSEKSESPNDYWIELTLGGNVMFPSSQPLFTVNQGAIFNLSEHIALGLDVQVLLNRNARLEDGNKQLTLNTFGYGFNVVFRW